MAEATSDPAGQPVEYQDRGDDADGGHTAGQYSDDEAAGYASSVRLFGTNELGAIELSQRDDGTDFGGGGMTQTNLHLYLATQEYRDMYQLNELCVFAAAGDDGALYAVLNGGAHPDTPDVVGRTALFYTVISQSVSCAELLLSTGANGRTVDIDGRSPMHWAAYHGCHKIIKVFIEAGFGDDVALADKEGRTALHWCTVATGKGHKAAQTLIKAFKDKGINPSPVDGDKMTPLHWASFHNNAKCCELLLKGGAKSDAADVDGKTPLHWMCASDDPACAKVLTKFDKKVVNSRDNALRTALHMSVAEGKLGTVEVLLKVSTCDVNPQDNTGRTPLHWAAAMNLKECIVMLLAAKANPALIDNEGASALHYAAQHNHIESIELLATSAELTNIEDKNGATPLMWAAAGNHEAAMRTLLKCGAEVNYVDASGRTALHTAVYGGSVECTSLLLESAADEAIADESGQTALFSACNEGRVDLAAILLESGSDPRAQDVEARTPAHWAAIGGHRDVVELLVTASPEIISEPDERGETIIHYSCFFGHPEIVTYLITAKADVNAQDFDGITALHWGALKGHTGIVQQLCEAGAYPNYMEANGAKSTPYDYAVNGEFEECAAMIADFGGVDNPTMQYYAAIIIQSAWRGLLGRRIYRKLFEQRSAAATTIAAHYKGFSQKKKYSTHKEEVAAENAKRLQEDRELASADEAKASEIVQRRVNEENTKRAAAEAAAVAEEVALKEKEIVLAAELAAMAKEADQQLRDARERELAEKQHLAQDLLAAEEQSRNELKEAKRLEAQHKRLQAKAAKKEQEALKEIEDSGAKVRPPPTVVPRDKPVPVKKLANFYKANKPKPAAHHVEADAAAAALEAEKVQSSSTMADQQIRRFLVKKEKDRIQQIRIKIHAARVIQRCYRRFKIRGGSVDHWDKTSSRDKTRRGQSRQHKVITSPRTMSGQISSPTNMIKSPTPSAVYHRVVTEEELIRSMTATVKKPMVTAENKIYGTTSVGPRFKKKAPIVAKMVTMHSGYKTYPAFEPVTLPKMNKASRRRTGVAKTAVKKPTVKLPHIPRPEDILAGDIRVDSQIVLEREIAALTIQLWWRKLQAKKFARTHRLIHTHYGAAHEVRMQSKKVISIYGRDPARALYLQQKLMPLKPKSAPKGTRSGPPKRSRTSPKIK